MLHRTKGGLTASDTVGLVVEYAPATGETRVRFPDGVVQLQTKRPIFFPEFSFFALTAFKFRFSSPRRYKKNLGNGA
jgi:hypothetical protein